MTTRPAAISRALTAAVGGPGAGAGCCGLQRRPSARSAPPTKSGLPPATAARRPRRSPPTTRRSCDWTKCGNLECADLRVPLDHAAPDPSKDLTIKVARVKARDQAKRLGSLLVNPGGPGASGIDYVRGGADTIGGPDVRRYYDLVGFDPRGVGRSDPINCLSDKALDRFLARRPDARRRRVRSRRC